MRKIALCFICLTMIAITARSQSIEKLFDKYSNDTRLEFVSVGDVLSNLVASSLNENEKSNVAAGALGFNGMKILTLSDTTEIKLLNTIRKDLSNVLYACRYDTLVQVREKGNHVNIYCRTQKNIADMLIVTDEGKTMTLIWMKGNSMEEMMKMVNY